MAHPDLLIVGGGIIGCSAAAFAAERGASVVLVEATEIGAGASGRNSGVVQHPFDPVLAGLHEATLDHYRALTGDGGFRFPSEPAGLLLLTDDPAAGRARVVELHSSEPALAATLLDEQALREREPMLAGGLSAVLLATGYPVPPHAATQAMAGRAERAGAEIRLGVRAVRIQAGPSLRLDDGTSLHAGAILVAAGPWSADLLDPTGAWRPIRPTYGVTVQVTLSPTPRSVLEEGAVHTVNRPVDEDEPANGLFTFSMVTAEGVSTVGSTFLPAAPDPGELAPRLVAHGARFVPALAGAAIVRSRVCARPQSIDGRPFIGPVAGMEGVYLAAGHGPWGISTGPASAAMVVDAILDGKPTPAELEAARLG
jgi:glycine/D-amino acid oxidase-like deaminating enzyme